MSDTFNYTYSAARQKEIQAIRNKYTENSPPAEADKLEMLRKLDKSATDKATVWSLAVGILSALVMGAGMSLVMTDIGQKIKLPIPFAIGIGIGFIGIFGVIAAYPLYRHVLKAQRKKIAPEILRLADELTEK